MNYDQAIQSEHALIGVVLLAVAGAMYRLGREVSRLRGQLEGKNMIPRKDDQG